MKHMEHQKRRASLSNDDEEEEEEGSEGEDKDLVVHQSALDVSRRFGDGAGPSGSDRAASVTAEERFAQKRVASSSPRGPSPKCPCAAVEVGQDSSCMASITPSLTELGVLVHGVNAKSAAETSATTRVDNEVCYPSLEMPGGEDQDLL